MGTKVLSATVKSAQVNSLLNQGWNGGFAVCIGSFREQFWRVMPLIFEMFLAGPTLI
jgi:ribulose bisphosphate carboxylase small subunit